ncbi:hypothetical protein PROFUN_03357 [Planoprotostelium fungivorum]|uniref:Uncharacterized protein n=1 Tax=Planoprotostelium fungivorum TaxID=1890364 RepID=A0A2P6NWI4_9EUKA|nr:hypothetical protein PROFUN_03357 [Planoprotostelium fungivorum]
MAQFSGSVARMIGPLRDVHLQLQGGASEKEKRPSPLRGRVICKKGDRGTLYPYGTHRFQRRQHLKSIPKHPLGKKIHHASQIYLFCHSSLKHRLRFERAALSRRAK